MTFMCEAANKCPEARNLHVRVWDTVLEKEINISVIAQPTTARPPSCTLPYSAQPVLHPPPPPTLAVRGAPQWNAQNALAVTSGQRSATKYVTLYPWSLATCDSGIELCLLKNDTAYQSAQTLSKYIITLGSESSHVKAWAKIVKAGVESYFRPPICVLGETWRMGCKWKHPSERFT